MKILVTGSNGLIGIELVKQLVNKGYEVVGFDVQDESEVKEIEYFKGDIRNYEEVLNAMKNCDMVAHLAALPSPTFGSPQKTFDINLMGTYNVYDAAEQLGIKRVVQASSVNAAGMTWNNGDFIPDHFPIDESQTISTSCPYSLSKHLGEEVGFYYARRSGISGTGLRFPGVFPIGFLGSEKHVQQAKEINEFLDNFLAMDLKKQEELLEGVRDKVLTYRKAKSLEYSTKKPEPSEKELGDIPKGLWDQYMWYRFMLWSQVDVRDAGRSFVLSLEGDYEGFYPLYINDEVNYTGYDSRKLLNRFYPGVAYDPEAIKANGTLISNKKAKEIIGYEPEFSLYLDID